MGANDDGSNNPKLSDLIKNQQDSLAANTPGKTEDGQVETSPEIKKDNEVRAAQIKFLKEKNSLTEISLKFDNLTTDAKKALTLELLKQKAALKELEAKQKQYNEAQAKTNKLFDELTSGKMFQGNPFRNIVNGLKAMDDQGHLTASGIKKWAETSMAKLTDFKVMAGAFGTALLKASTAYITAIMLEVALLEQYTVGLVRATGMSNKLANESVKLSESLLAVGVSTGTTAQASEALFKDYTDFTKVSASTRETITKTTAMLENMGVSSSVTAGNMQFMSKSLGMTGEQAAESTAEFATLARQIGMVPGEMSAQFQQSAPILAKFGRQAPEVFKKLAVAARRAGMDVSSMLSITEKFDTFAGAAESVGSLNAILGGPYLNSMDMVMETDPTERMRMLSQALNDTGQSFEQMDYYTRKSIAAAAGLSDVNELALVMNGRFDLVGDTINQTGDDIEKLAEQQADYNTVMDQLKNIMKTITISVAKHFMPIVQRVSQFFADNGPEIAKYTQIVITLGFALGTLTGALLLLVGLLVPGAQLSLPAGMALFGGSLAGLGATGLSAMAWIPGAGQKMLWLGGIFWDIAKTTMMPFIDALTIIWEVTKFLATPWIKLIEYLSQFSAVVTVVKFLFKALAVVMVALTFPILIIPLALGQLWKQLKKLGPIVEWITTGIKALYLGFGLVLVGLIKALPGVSQIILQFKVMKIVAAQAADIISTSFKNIVDSITPAFNLVKRLVELLMKIPAAIGNVKKAAQAAKETKENFSPKNRGWKANMGMGALKGIAPQIGLPLTMMGLADGGVTTGPTPAVVGEAGPEAVLPLAGKGGQVLADLFTSLISRNVPTAPAPASPTAKKETILPVHFHVEVGGKPLETVIVNIMSQVVGEDSTIVATPVSQIGIGAP